MAAICRNTQMGVTRRFKAWRPNFIQQSRRYSTSREERLCAARRVQGILLDTVPCSNFIFKRQLQTSLKVRSNLRDEDIVASQITSASTADNIFVMLNGMDVLTSPHIIATFGALDKLMHAQLVAQPWAIYDDPAILFMQSILNSEASEIFDPVLRCPEFDRLCYETQKCRTTLSNSELVNVTRFMTRMHVDLHSDVFRNMLSECQLRHEEFDLEMLMNFSDVGNFIQRSGFVISAQIVRALQKQWGDLEMTEQNFLAIIKLLHSVGHFMTKDTLFIYQEKILEMLKRYHETVPPGNLMKLVKALSRFLGHITREISEMAGLQIMNRLDEVSLWNLPAVAFQLMHVTGISNTKVMGMLARRCSSMLTKSTDDLRSADVVALVRMSPFINYSPNSMKVLEFLLEDRMKNLDVLLLKYTSVSSLMPMARNAGLVQAYCDQVQLKMKDLFKSLSCLLTVTHCLAKIPARPAEFDRVYSHHLMQNILDHQLGAQTKNMVTIGRYLVQCFKRSDLRSVGIFTEKLINLLPLYTLIDIANVSLGINSFDNLITRTHYEHIITNFAREILLRSNQIDNISVLNILVKSVFVKLNSPFRDAIINDLEELYITHTPSLTMQSVKQTCHLLKELRMHVAVLCDRLVAVIAGSNCGTTANLSNIAQVLDLLIRVNYRPSDLETVLEIAASKISEMNYMQGSDMMDVLVIANSLASFQMFSEDVIKRVFSLDFIMGLDTWIASKTSTSRKQQLYFYRILSELNRSVMLQCPQLGESVAWFCDNFSKSSYFKLDSNTITTWKESVHAGLKDALGGSEYVKKGPLATPYNHSYDFECFLDEYGKPLPIETDQEHVRCRVVVLLSTPTNYCSNTRTLSGHIANKVAQLEILGFKVVMLPYSHLDSMMLSEPSSRRKYFYDMIVDGVN